MEDQTPAPARCMPHNAIAMHFIREQWRHQVRITLFSLAGLADDPLQIMQHDLQHEAVMFCNHRSGTGD